MHDRMATYLFDTGVSLQSIWDLLGYGYDEMTQQYVDYMSEKIDQAMDSRIEQLQNQLAQLQRENAELKKENAKLHKAPIRKNLNLIKSL